MPGTSGGLGAPSRVERVWCHQLVTQVAVVGLLGEQCHAGVEGGSLTPAGHTFDRSKSQVSLGTSLGTREPMVLGERMERPSLLPVRVWSSWGLSHSA